MLFVEAKAKRSVGDGLLFVGAKAKSKGEGLLEAKAKLIGEELLTK